MTIPDAILDMGWTKINMYIYIKRKCGKSGECELSMRELADAFALTRPTASRYLTEFEECGFLWRNGHQTDTKRTLISLKTKPLDMTDGHQTDTKRTLISLKTKPLDMTDGHQTDTKRTLEERKHAFGVALIPYMDKGYPKEMIRAFFDHWTQVNEGGTKMHFEKQQTFQIPNRLAAWKRNNYGKERTPTDIGMVLQPEKDKFKDEKEW